MNNTDRIVGGTDAPSMIPWQVFVITGGYVCGGSIIDAYTILSAAHCFQQGQSVNTISIRAGSLNKYHGGQVLTIFLSNTSCHDSIFIK